MTIVLATEQGFSSIIIQFINSLNKPNLQMSQSKKGLNLKVPKTYLKPNDA